MLSSEESIAHLEFYKELGFNLVPLSAVHNGQCNCYKPEGVVCQSPGKHPAISRWIDYQSKRNSSSELEEWFKAPIGTSRNIAVVTGEISNIIVLDFDDYDTADLFSEAEPRFMDSLVAKTGKGFHIYLRPNRKVKTTTFILNDKLHHVKAEGGYVVAPPSVHYSGNYYSFLEKKEPIEYEVEKLSELIISLGGQAKQSAPIDRSPDWASELLEKTVEGSRNSTAAQLCGLMIAKFPNDPALVEWIMKHWNSEFCNPPLSEWELDNLIKGMYYRYASQ